MIYREITRERERELLELIRESITFSTQLSISGHQRSMIAINDRNGRIDHDLLDRSWVNTNSVPIDASKIVLPLTSFSPLSRHNCYYVNRHETDVELNSSDRSIRHRFVNLHTVQYVPFFFANRIFETFPFLFVFCVRTRENETYEKWSMKRSMKSSVFNHSHGSRKIVEL